MSVIDEEGEAGVGEVVVESGRQAKVRVRWDFMGWGSDDRATRHVVRTLGAVCAEMQRRVLLGATPAFFLSR